MEVFAVSVLLQFVRGQRLFVLALVVTMVARELLARPVLLLVRDHLRTAPALELAAFIAGQHSRRV